MRFSIAAYTCLEGATLADKPVSVQTVQDQEPLIGGPAFPLFMFRDTQNIAPSWDQMDRDIWLRVFWKDFGNDMLAAVLSTSVAKIQAQNWTISGPKRLAKLYHGYIRDDADFGAGYDSMISRGVQDYYTQDNGWFMERLRSGPKDHEGPCLGLAHLDSARMYPSGNADFPYYFNDIDGEYHLMHRAQLIRIVDLPTPVTALHHHNRGFCALSRALSTAMVLTMLVTMKREKLSDLPPSALAIFNNISRKQFESALSVQGAQEDSKGNAVWRSLMPLFGMDPAHPADLKFLSLREVWEGFDEMTAYNVAAFSFAAAWRMDPREFWPVSSGQLGTGKEVEVQAEKAKAKSTGLLFTQLERAFNHRDTLPEGVTFKFELQDAGDELQEAQIHAIQIQNVKAMQDAGAQLTAAEVRYLFSMEYGILPREMLEVPEAPPENQPGMGLGALGMGQTPPGQSNPHPAGLEQAGITPDQLANMSMDEIAALEPAAATPTPGAGPEAAGAVPGQPPAPGAPPSTPGNENTQPILPGAQPPEQAPGAVPPGGQPGKPGLPGVPGVPNSSVPGVSGTAGPPPLPAVSPKLDIDTVRIDDVERDVKEYYGMDMGPTTSYGLDGKVSYPLRLKRPNDNHGPTPEAIQAAKSVYLTGMKQNDGEDVLDKIKDLPEEEQRIIRQQANRLRALMDPSRRLDFLNSIPDDTWNQAQAEEVENG